MSENNIKQPPDFFRIIRNAQPIAFLASLCLIIATFSFTNFQAVYSNAVIAAFSFIFSFIFSTLIQLKWVQEDKFFIRATRSGAYFFLGVGVLYLLLIAVEFGKTLPQMFSLIQGWWSTFIGGALFYPVYFMLKKIETKRGADLYYEATLAILTALGATGIFIMGVNALTETFFGQRYLTEMPSLIFALGGVGVFVIFERFIKIKKQFKKGQSLQSN